MKTPRRNSFLHKRLSTNLMSQTQTLCRGVEKTKSRWWNLEAMTKKNEAFFRLAKQKKITSEFKSKKYKENLVRHKRLPCGKSWTIVRGQHTSNPEAQYLLSSPLLYILRDHQGLDENGWCPLFVRHHLHLPSPLPLASTCQCLQRHPLEMFKQICKSTI